jgi:hypothetical protein
MEGNKYGCFVGLVVGRKDGLRVGCNDGKLAGCTVGKQFFGCKEGIKLGLP